MNILFCTTSQVSEQRGGTERITARISNGLRDKGHKCYNAFKSHIPNDFPLTTFDGTINAMEESLNDYILVHQINVIIVQKMTRDVKVFRKIIDENRINCKIISVLHFNPGYEEKKITWNDALLLLKEAVGFKESTKGLIRITLYPIYKFLYPLRNRELYKKVYKYSDKMVLLSQGVIKDYKQYARIKENNKFIAIPNALSFNQFFNTKELNKKKKQVLVVSRLDETIKRISIAINIWANIENDPEFNDWQFKIVGYGDAENKYKKQIKDLNLKRISLEGRQEPLPYYKESSIFMMTSSSEGWGLTLTEAQQMGCVPVAFNSYSSLHDIITDGNDGFIISNNDVSTYTARLKQLMTDEKLRNNMAQNAINNSHRFELAEIIKQWESLILN